jgi:hypothetical protein
MFEGWDSYFLLIGGAAGALIGLLFVVASLPSGLERQRRLAGASLYMTPTVFDFAVVVVLSGVALVPHLPSRHVALAVGICALAGAIYLGLVAMTMARGKLFAPSHWSDLWCYGMGPFVIYLGLGAAAAAAALAAIWAPLAVAGAAMALLLLGIRNAWDLVTWLSPGAPGTPSSPDNPGESRS